MEQSPEERRASPFRLFLWLLLPLAAGILLSLLIPRPAVGVIYLDDALYGASSRELASQIVHARQDPAVRALVLVMNTPGGTVSDTESVYRELMLLRRTKPVVAVVEGMAASGGYYLASASDYIFSKASSEVGNVGVIGYLPDSPVALETVYSTGPYKMWGMPRESFYREMEMLKQQFLQVVLNGRGERLRMTVDEILGGQIYAGGDALRLGLVDEFGSVSDGIEKAASLARIAHPRTMHLKEFALDSESTPEPFFQGSSESLISSFPNKAGIYFLYVHPAEKGLP